MSSKDLFKSAKPARLTPPPAPVRNHAGGRAYERSAEEALAQYAITGCLGSTFYTSAKEQLGTILELAGKCAPDVVADIAIGARRGHMKDTPALLLAHLASRKDEESAAELARVFPAVLDNGRMIRNFVQIIRSGVTGRKSLGSLPKRLIQQWFERSSVDRLFRDSVGNDPSLVDVIRLVHPRPSSPEKNALFGYMLERKFEREALPRSVREYDAFKRGTGPMPEDAPFMMLSAHVKTPADWRRLAQRMSWTELRINLATLGRHGVFENRAALEDIAQRLADPALIKRSRVFPYQILAAYTFAEGLPPAITNALQTALDIATENVPVLPGDVKIAIDISGSMGYAITGGRGAATSKMRAIDLAAVYAASILRTNPTAEVIAFNSGAARVPLNGRDSVMTNTAKLVGLLGGGTACAAPLALLNRDRARVDTLIMISDNESWKDTGAGRGTATMNEWLSLKSRNPAAKFVTMDVTPSSTSQVAEVPDVLRVGGFSDQVFDVIASFAAPRSGSWLDAIRARSRDAGRLETDG